MLLARLQGEREAGVARGIERAPDDAPGHLPHVLHARRHKAEVRPAGAQRHAERLTFPDRDIRAAGTPLPGGFEERERGGIDDGDHQDRARMCPIGECIHILEAAKKVRLLDHERGDVLPVVPGEGGGQRDALRGAKGELLELQPLVCGGRDRDLAIVRMYRGRHQDARRLRLAVGAHRHECGLCGGGGAVVHRGVRDLHAGQARNHGLEFVDQLQRALARLRLVGGVGAVELPARGDGPHRRGNVVLVGTGTDEGERRTVSTGTLGHQAPDFHFVELLRHAGEGLDAQIRRDLIEEILDAGGADGGEHRRDIGFGVGNEGHQPPSASRTF